VQLPTRLPRNVQNLSPRFVSETGAESTAAIDWRRFTEVAQVVEAAIAEFEAELIFALGMEGAVALVTSGIFRASLEFVGESFWMDL
jgi:hypothetical protein